MKKIKKKAKQIRIRLANDFYSILLGVASGIIANFLTEVIRARFG